MLRNGERGIVIAPPLKREILYLQYGRNQQRQKVPFSVVLDSDSLLYITEPTNESSPRYLMDMDLDPETKL